MSGTTLRKAKDIMQRDVIALRPEMSLRQAAQLFSDCNISGAPVVDDDQNVVGVLSQTDLLRNAVQSEEHTYFHHGFYQELPMLGAYPFAPEEQFGAKKVADLMSPYVVTAAPSDSVSALARSLREHKFHRLIIAEDGKLVGIVTSSDLLRVLEDFEH